MNSRLSNQHINEVSDLQSLLCQEWYSCMKNEFANKYWDNIIKKLNSTTRYLPAKKDIFNALNLCPPSKVKVVILGQDPYIHSNEAHGFSFSVPDGTRIPPSLMNVFKELSTEYNINTVPSSGCLTKWAEDGVLLLNSILTVDEGASNSHKNIGWENFTSAIIRWIDNHKKCVFLSWGVGAQKITSQQVVNNKVLTAGHPSPLNTKTPFVGCNCFREANDLLKEMNILPVRWLSVFEN